MQQTTNIQFITNDLKHNLQEWNVTSVFKRKGIQAICGCIEKKIKGTDENPTRVVYKLSAYPDRTNEHEEFICSQTNQLRCVSPHFVASYGSANLPITNTFIEENSKYVCKCENCSKLEASNHTIFTRESDQTKYKHRHVLFLEYISHIHLKHALRTGNKQLSMSQIILSLAAIQQGIDAIQFCHYDLHIDNILVKECDPHSYFAYRFKNGETVLCPTRGYYPVFIDFGTSYTYFYTQPEYNNQCRVSTINSHYGLQPTLFDRLADVHQLIISGLYECQLDSDTYYALTTHVMHHFRTLPLYRTSGWKKCSFDVFTLLTERIAEYEPSLEDDYPIWGNKPSQLIDVLALGIRLPFTQITNGECIKQFKQKYKCHSKEKEEIIQEALASSFKEICIQTTNIQRSLQLGPEEKQNNNGNNTNKGCKQDKYEIYYILREIVEATSEQKAKDIKGIYKMGKKCNTVLLYHSIKDFCKLLSHFYEIEFTKNKEIVETMYKDIYFTGITHIINYFLQHIPIRPSMKGIVDVHCYDMQTMTTKVCKLDTTTYRPGRQWRNQVCDTLFSSF